MSATEVDPFSPSLNFNYPTPIIDNVIADRESLNFLFTVTDEYRGDCGSIGVFTAYIVGTKLGQIFERRHI